MDPNLFHIDWERTFEALAGIVVLSFFVERALALLFESRWWIGRLEEPRLRIASKGKKTPGPDAGSREADEAADSPAERNAPGTNAPGGPKDSAQPESRPALAYPLKEILAFLVALAVCVIWEFDAVSIVLLSEKTSLVGMVVTAAVIAGGTKSSVALFHNLLGVKSSAVEAKKKLRDSDGRR